MKVYRKMITMYRIQLVKYYKSLKIDKSVYECDMDFNYINNLRDNIKDGFLSPDNKLFLVRSVLSLRCKDKEILKKITIMVNSEDEEIHNLAETLIEKYI